MSGYTPDTAHLNAAHPDAAADALGEIRALHRSGRLAAAYPTVQRLLAGLGGADLLAAGRLLARLDPDDVLAAHPAIAAPAIAVTGHGTLSGLVPALSAELARLGLLGRLSLSDFDTWVLDLVDPDSALYAGRPAFVLLLLDPEVIADELPNPWRADDAEQVLAQKVALVERIADVFAATGRGATLVLNTIPLPHELTAQLLDLRERARLGAAWREANARLLRLAGTHPAVATVDLDPLLAAGVAAREPRAAVYAHAHLSDRLLAGFARQVAHLVRGATGGGRKVLALDLDDTVWGGVLGEVGPEGIEVDGGYRGQAFRRFQQVVRQIGAQGVLLAAVSKNDLEPVVAVLREHPGMVLREDDFAAVRADWGPKHRHLTELAAELGLGVDSIVFVDDNPFERGVVRSELPGVAVVEVDDEPALHVSRLLADGWFDVRELTSDDVARPARYRAERARRRLLDTAGSVDDYLRGLDITVTVDPAAPAQLARVSQLTLRTNQFNLNTRRLRPAEVVALAEDPAVQVLTVTSADRFGDNGLVGVVLTRRAGAALHIDDFLLSCRVFARGIEQSVLSAVLRRAHETGAAEVRAAYTRTAKNGKVADFYPQAGFVTLSADEAGAQFRHDLCDLPAAPPHVRLTARFEKDAP
ncbi:HAD-IIIC family phosphatase [Frankia sp. AiPs1]|uniref:HAD-IIIC family phosphatase n=1 Tax=Frankia sp. AiPs1 TaxID=573493 RepID=UPI00204497B6|nr:HAD-IIIC family phosphatase [Frankia sp. AiPs1]MCM3922994.1 HAD-IIIC family phosphatase [Frankia sp. AiPs1]